MTHPPLQDAMLPGLALAFDADALLGVLNQASAHQGAGVHFRGIALERFRYRAGAKAVFLYQCDLETSSGPLKTWLSADVFPGRKARKRHAQLAKADAGALRDRAFLLGGDGILCSVFPLDPALPGLADCEGQSWEALRYRPHIGATFREGYAETAVFHKFMPPPEAARLADLTHARMREQFKEASAVGLPNLLELDPARGRASWSAVVGTPLSECVSSRPDAGALAGAVGAQLGRAASILLPADGRLIVEQVRIEAEKWAAFLSHPELYGEAWLHPLMTRLNEGLGIEGVGLAHGDLKPDHIFVQPDGAVGLVDVETLGVGMPILDVGTLCVRLASTAADHSAAKCFAEAWLEEAGRFTHQDLGVGVALGYLRLAVFHVQHLTPDWRAEARDCLRAANAALQGSLPWDRGTGRA